MGSVWLADHLALETEVVVKFMHQQLGEDPINRERFSREAIAASRVKSPHVVQTFDHGVTPEGIPFIVMEKLDGEDLARRLERGTLAPRDLAPILNQVCKALTRAHSAGVVHRDIKPDNIFLCDVGTDEPFVKLLDFGIAKTALNPKLDNKTRTGAMMGTPYYMSPEQFAGAKEIDFRTDLWSLGVVAFEALTGSRPFDAETIGGLAIAVHSGELPMPSSRRSDLRPIDAWFARACCRQLAGRHQSAREFAESFAAAASGVTAPAATSSLVITGSGLDAGPLSSTHPSPAEPSPAPVAAPATTSFLMTTGASGALESERSSPAAPPARARVALYVAAGALVVVGMGALTVLGRHPAAPAAAATPPVAVEQAKPEPATAPAAAPQPAVQLAALPAAAAPAASPAESAASASPALPSPHPAGKSPAATPPAHGAALPPPAHSSPAPAPKSVVNCNPPFTIDASGVKHPKPECL